MVEFAGWRMPVYYGGILQERNAVRKHVGLFDVSHMGQVLLDGAGAVDAADYLLTNSVGGLEVGQGCYSLMCNTQGGILDDLVVFRKSATAVWIVVNASRREADVAWMREHLRPGAELTDASVRTAMVAIQGPAADRTLQRFASASLASVAYYHCQEMQVAGMSCLVSRTGYTGEDGFEISLAWEQGPRFWDCLAAATKAAGGALCGLGARDLLRLEAGYPLYGQDIDERHDAYQAGLGWAVRLQKDDFLGKDALVRLKQAPPAQRLVMFVLETPRVPRPHSEVLVDHQAVGEVTSGSQSPDTGRGIGLAYVKSDYAEPEQRIAVAISGRDYPGRVIRRPLVKGSVHSRSG